MTQLTLEELSRRIETLNAKLESAFPRDDQGYPDYAAHRLFHRRQEQEQEEYEKNKNKIKRDILTWAAVGALTIICGLLAKTFLLPSVLLNIK